MNLHSLILPPKDMKKDTKFVYIVTKNYQTHLYKAPDSLSNVCRQLMWLHLLSDADKEADEWRKPKGKAKDGDDNAPDAQKKTDADV